MSDKRVKFEGNDADVHWDGRLCIHIGECGRANNDLFVGGRKPWCEPDRVTPDEAAEVVERCPTGALTFVRKGGASPEVAAAENEVRVTYNGPLFLRGELEIDGAADDMDGVRFRAALCRCGLSDNKPFCDNNHEKGGFKDYGAVGESGEGLESAGGPLKVIKVPNGPLLLNGNFTISASSGRVAWSGARAALCRCGHSGNKPFCDGSHKGAEFKAG